MKKADLPHKGYRPGSRYDLIEGWFAHGAQTPPHLHREYSEQLYVLDGEFTVWIGGRKVMLRPGDDHLIPAGTAHAVAATGDHPSRALVVASPSGIARLVNDAGTPDERGEGEPVTPFDMARFIRVAADQSDEILGPPESLPG